MIFRLVPTVFGPFITGFESKISKINLRVVLPEDRLLCNRHLFHTILSMVFLTSSGVIIEGFKSRNYSFRLKTIQFADVKIDFAHTLCNW